MNSDEYRQYLLSDHWKVLSGTLKERRGSCEECGIKDTLNVHHKTYERLGHEFITDLEVLCERCHKNQHIIQDRLKYFGRLCSPESEVINNSEWLRMAIGIEQEFWNPDRRKDDD